MTQSSRAVSAALPRPFDVRRFERTMEALAAAGVAIAPEQTDLLAAIFGNSPYLARLARREPDCLTHVLVDGPNAALRRMSDRALACAQLEDASKVMAALRSAKRGAALAIALADIACVWDVEGVTRVLSEFADSCVKGALRFLLRDAALRSDHAETDGEVLERTTGLVVLAMGKYGAFELNYSSDIDLIVFYDAARFPFRSRDDTRSAAVTIVRGLVRLLSEITSDGYVFRTDLRLRPDAGATQIAISTDAAEAYYENMGQNWERAAMIKARACAGDPNASQRFLKAIEPFIWRRHLDYAAIEDIHSIKRQIHAHAGHGSIAVAGHNIKLGRGGIREIEFFAQTQQLILGGRNRNLREAGTVAALDALCTHGLLLRETANDLQSAYRFLRQLEHRLQMIEDEQTHTLPKTAEGLDQIACFMGFSTTDAFKAALTRELETVQGHYAHLFERSQQLASDTGNLVFTGVDDDPDTLRSLLEMGFREAHHVANAIRGWHHGRIPATRSARARELLTRLVPALLKELAATPDPDSAFMQFDRFVSNLPAGVQLFSLLMARPELLQLIARIMGSAPRLARHLSRSPQTLDTLLDRDFPLPPARAELDLTLAKQLATASEYEDKLDAVRRFAREQIFRIGVQVIEGMVVAHTAGTGFASIAECVTAGLAPVVEDQLALSVGRVPGGEFAVVAMGKLGGREMTAASDLDLIFVYETQAGAESSDGRKKLPAMVYYARFAQRLIAALTVPTAAGDLYEVDMRLRPSGNKGPAAVSLESFSHYHALESWTWERMALTRARVISGPPELRAKIEAVIDRTVAAAPEPGRNVRADARSMRERLESQFPGRNSWDLKFAPGGLVDIEFIAQTLQLGQRGLRRQGTLDAIAALAASDRLSKQDAAALADAANYQLALNQTLRIAVEGIFRRENATPGLKTMLVRAGGAASFAELEARLAWLQSQTRQIFERILP